MYVLHSLYTEITTPMLLTWNNEIQWFDTFLRQGGKGIVSNWQCNQEEVLSILSKPVNYY